MDVKRFIEDSVPYGAATGHQEAASKQCACITAAANPLLFTVVSVHLRPAIILGNQCCGCHRHPLVHFTCPDTMQYTARARGCMILRKCVRCL